MTSRILSAFISLASLMLVPGCGGGGGGGGDANPPPPPPPPEAMSAAGTWVGDAVTPDVPDIVTSFEFDDADGFTLGNAPYTAVFEGGVTETRGVPQFYTDGVFSWHVDTADGSITFPTPGDSLSFFTRTVTAGDNATIEVLDEFGAQIQQTAVPDAFAEISVNPNPGDPGIGSVVITVDTGEIVIDSFTFGFPSTASTDDVACLFTPDPEDDFVCVVTDTATSEPLAGANGTFQVNGDQVSGSGNLYAAPGETLADGSTVAELTVDAGTVAEDSTLDLTINSVGLDITVTTMFDDTFNRGADLATVEAMYTSFDLFGEMSSFNIDATGAIDGQSASGCVLSGQVSVLEPAANVYNVDLVADAATCGALGGDYNGLGTTQDDAAMDDAFIFAVFVDGQQMIVGEAVK